MLYKIELELTDHEALELKAALEELIALKEKKIEVLQTKIEALILEALKEKAKP